MSKSTWHPHKFQNLIKNTCFFVPGISQRYCVVWLTQIQDISHHYCKLSTTDLGWVYHSYLYTHIFTYIYIYVCICVYVCIYIYVYIHSIRIDINLYTQTHRRHISRRAWNMLIVSLFRGFGRISVRWNVSCLSKWKEKCSGGQVQAIDLQEVKRLVKHIEAAAVWLSFGHSIAQTFKLYQLCMFAVCERLAGWQRGAGTEVPSPGTGKQGRSGFWSGRLELQQTHNI